LRRAAAGNLLKALGLFAALCTFFGGIGWLVGEYRGLLLFLGCAVGLAGAVYAYGDRFVLGMLGARELPLAEAPALHSLVEGLAARARLPKPKLYVLPDGHPRALSAGRGPRGAALAVSQGLLGAAPPAELEGVVAHELAHVARRDVLVQTVVVVVAATLIELSRIGGFLERALLFVLAPIGSAFVHLLLSPRREFAADRAAATLCQSPHGLADALVRLELAGGLVEFKASPATEPVYTVNPFEETGLAALFVTHPRPEERVRRLRELDPGWRDRLEAA
jgi:heat shock protein HtpX